MRFTGNLRSIIAMLMAVLLFSCMDAMLKVLAGAYPQFQVTALRGLMAVPWVLGYVLWRRELGVVFSRRLQWRLHLLRGVIGVLMMGSLQMGTRVWERQKAGPLPGEEQLVLGQTSEWLAQAMPGFTGVPMSRWAEEAVRHYVQGDGRLDLPHDPLLRVAFDAAMAGPSGDLWAQFDACAALPMALIRGSGSDVLSPETAAEMKRRRPDLIVADVPDRGHIPFLDEAPALAAIDLWLSAVRARLDQASGGA
jgi:hypothetical protein